MARKPKNSSSFSDSTENLYTEDEILEMEQEARRSDDEEEETTSEIDIESSNYGRLSDIDRDTEDWDDDGSWN